MDQSVLFTAYNQVKAKARAMGPEYEKRANRALGQIQAGIAESKITEYQTDGIHCNCGDSEHRQFICKHSFEKSILAIYSKLVR
jgi:hypothetical protein